MGDAPAAADRRHAARRCTVDFGLSAPDLFRQPHRRPVRARHLLGREADRFARDDRSALARPRDRLDRHDPRRLLRRDAVDGFRPRARAARAPDVPAHHRRCDGRLHLLGGHGFRRDLRRGQQHRQPAQLVAGQLFRHFVGQYLRHSAGRADLARVRRAAVQADERLSARRGLRAQHGRQYPRLPRRAHPALERALRLRGCVRWADFIRRHCRSRS